jgi:hypothetical protein
MVFQWILSHWKTDTLAKGALNLPSPEQLTTYQQAVPEITRQSHF